MQAVHLLGVPSFFRAFHISSKHVHLALLLGWMPAWLWLRITQLECIAIGIQSLMNAW